jgi:hypothetical protein
MSVRPVVVGSLLAAGVMVAITASQAETKVVRGQPQRVVPWVARGHVYDVPLAKRGLWVGIPAGLVGAGIGYFTAEGAHVGAALLGALALGGFSASWREKWPDRFGQAGANAQVADAWLNGLVGALLGAGGAALLAKHHDNLPQRLQPPEPSDVC